MTDSSTNVPENNSIWRLKSKPDIVVKVGWADDTNVVIEAPHFKGGCANKSLGAFLDKYEQAESA